MFRALAVLVALCFALLPQLAEGAAPAAEQPPAAAAEKPTAPAAPPNEAVGEWSIQATQRLSEIRERLSGSSEIEKLEKSLAVLEKRFDENLGDVVAHPDSAHVLTEAAIRDATSELDTVTSGTTSISEVLAQRSAAMEAVSKEIGEMIKRAQSARAPSETPLPEAIRARLDTILSESDRLLRIAQQRLDRAAKLQNKILVLQDRARTARADLTEVSAERLRALIRVQQPPLWRMTFDDIGASSAGSSRFLGQALPSAWQFAQDNLARVILHVGVFVARVCARFVSAPTVRNRAARRQNVTRRDAADLGRDCCSCCWWRPSSIPMRRRAYCRSWAWSRSCRWCASCCCTSIRRCGRRVYALTGTLLLERITSAFARDIVLQRLWLLLLSIVAIALVHRGCVRSASIPVSVSDGTCHRSSDG